MKKNLNSMIIDNSYFKWLEAIMKDKEELIDEARWGYNLDKEDKEKFGLIHELVKKLVEFTIKNDKEYESLSKYYVRYNEEIYCFENDGEIGFICRKVFPRDEKREHDVFENFRKTVSTENEKNIIKYEEFKKISDKYNTKIDKYIIEYDEFRKFCKKNMKENFLFLKNRVNESLNNTDLERINYVLSQIDGPTLVSGVGGSSVVSEYTSKILGVKNHIITRNSEPRDFNYLDLELYKNVVACSYSGNNYGVKLAFLNSLKHYLLASKENEKDDITNLTYKCLDNETSFISLGATLIPCSILLNYYLDNDKERILDNINEYNFDFDCNCDCFEIFSGLDTSTLSTYLDSTMTEAGIGIPVVHDKYSYCHGRSTLSTVKNNIAIYFNGGKELDKLYLEELPKYYKDVIVIDAKDNLVDEYKALVKCMYLTKYIAEQKNIDLSGVDYSPIVKKLYYYNGKM